MSTPPDSSPANSPGNSPASSPTVDAAVDPATGSAAVPVSAPSSAKATPKSEATRALILETAMRMFRERGYDKTTMRAIAAEAGVSVGNAYYYFESKEFLIQGFYDRTIHEHAEYAKAQMAGNRDFAARLEIALSTWVDCAAPYHEFAAQFFRTAADPGSPMSPFSSESHPARSIAVDLFHEVLSGSDLWPKLDAELAELLPDLLWLHLMVVVLYWVFDRTEDTERTRAFVHRSTPLLANVINLSRYRMFRPLLRDAKSLIHDFVLPVIGRSEGRSAAEAMLAAADDEPATGTGANLATGTDASTVTGTKGKRKKA